MNLTEATIVRGSASIAADGKCPGDCVKSSPEFMKFKSNLERLVNKVMVISSIVSINASGYSNILVS